MATAVECQYEALASQSDALQVIFESLPWGVIVADKAGRFLFSNPAAERISGNWRSRGLARRQYFAARLVPS